MAWRNRFLCSVLAFYYTFYWFTIMIITMQNVGTGVLNETFWPSSSSYFIKKIFFCIFYCNTLSVFSKCLLSWIVAMEPDGFWIISTMSMMQLAVFNTPSSQAVTNWIIDRVVQDYWVLNFEIILSKKKIGSVSSELSLHYSHTRWSLGLNKLSLWLPWATFSNKYRKFLTRLNDTFNLNNLWYQLVGSVKTVT